MPTQWVIIQSLEIMVMNNFGVHQQVNKQNLVYCPYCGLLVSSKKEGNSDTRYNMDGP